MALKELEQEGFLVRSPGKGTFVASMKIESGPRRILSFTQEMLNMAFRSAIRSSPSRRSCR